MIVLWIGVGLCGMGMLFWSINAWRKERDAAVERAEAAESARLPVNGYRHLCAMAYGRLGAAVERADAAEVEVLELKEALAQKEAERAGYARMANVAVEELRSIKRKMDNAQDGNHGNQN